ncbi:MAG TPA: ParB/RepB/Spo0J family partition protein [Candidatus Saccharimonadales bacterium]|nr:ParB/RepB/Spo0J family partition protein [Candidatus Saccharimonadales bacterium]
MSKKQTGLGRGLDSLIPKEFDESILADSSERIQKIDVTKIEANLGQPRRYFDDQALNELAESIKEHGLLQPIIVTPKGQGTYQIVAGERRWRATKIAGLETIPVIVRSTKELEKLEIALVENVQRVDLSPLEQAVSIERLHQQFSMDYPVIGKKLGKAHSTITNIVRLLQLPKEAKQALEQGKISEGHARQILALKGADNQKELLNLIVKKHWTVRQAENYVTAHKEGHTAEGKALGRVQNTTDETKAIAKKLNTKVSLKRLAKGGKLEIAFKSDDDLWRITNKIVGS